MIQQDVYIEREDWLVHCFLATNRDDTEPILSLLEDIGITPQQMMRAERHIYRATLNSGMTYSNPIKRKSVFVVAATTSDEEMVNTFSHELRHLVDDIAEANGIPTNGEHIAYLTGDIAMAIAANLLQLACHCPICSRH